MQSSLAYRPSLPVASPIMPRAQSGLSGTTDAVHANLAPDTSVAAITATMLDSAVHLESVLLSEVVTFVCGHGTNLVTVGLSPYGSVFGWAGYNAIYPLAYTEAGIGQSFLTAASGTVSYGMPMVQHVGLSESKHVDDAVLPIWEKIQAVTARVPEDAWKSVPPDLASNVDRYLYRKDDGR